MTQQPRDPKLVELCQRTREAVKAATEKWMLETPRWHAAREAWRKDKRNPSR
jgi:hypothetical protein